MKLRQSSLSILFSFALLLAATQPASAGEDIHGAFAAGSYKAVLGKLGVPAVSESDAITLDVPLLAENGALVSVNASSGIPNTEWIALIVDGNPSPLAALVNVKGADPRVVSRLKVGGDSQVRALVKAGGKYYQSSRLVKITEGGCGGGTAATPLVAAYTGPIGATRILGRMQGGAGDVRILIQHPMESGLRQNSKGDFVQALDKKTGKPVGPHYISHVTVALNGKPMMEAHWGPSVSKDPFLGLRIKGAKTGDTVSVRWEDNQGRKGERADKIG